MLMTPSANSDAISAQQHPTHHAPCLAPICSAPGRPSRQDPRRKPSGLRQCRRHMVFSGVSSYTAATTRTPPATQRPVRSQDNASPERRRPSSDTANASRPAAVHVSRYPATNTNGAAGLRVFVMLEYSATVGATDGNIIAAIITSQMPRNQASVPNSAPGPASMPRIRSTVNHHARTARSNNSAMSPTRLRAAVKTGRSPSTEAVTRSGGPGELRRRDGGLALIFDSEQADVCRLRLGDNEFRASRMEDAGDACGLPCFDAERHDVL